MKPGSILKFLTMRKLLSSLFFLALLSNRSFVFAQMPISDRQLLVAKDFHDSIYNNRKITFFLSKSKNPIVRYNPVSLTLGGLMYLYQKALSPQLSSQCSYKPSCSNFSKESIHIFGFIKGMALSADRLTRCNRVAYSDVSPLDFQNGKIADPPEKYRVIK